MMYISYTMKRTQIYLHPEQLTELARRSDARGVTASHLIREAVDQYLTAAEDEATELARQRSSLLEAFGALPHLPDGSQFVEEVRGADRARDEQMEERWRSR